ncbi:MAG: hypothetical protein K2K22_02990, partial [Muribaculaceae bacterium]|nr:hypothetical protein [Muribaculaceae bacterium]
MPSLSARSKIEIIIYEKITTIFAIIALAVSAAYVGSNPLRMKSGSLRELRNVPGTITCSMRTSTS